MTRQSSYDEILVRLQSALADTTEEPYYEQGAGEHSRSVEVQRKSIAILKSAIDAAATQGSTFRLQADRIVDSKDGDWYKRLQLRGVVEALEREYQGGYGRSLQSLVEADVFTDFLEMAEELISKKYKDPAAVIIGSVLEEHNRSLAMAVGAALEIDGVPVKAEALNAELKKRGVYEKGEQKQVTAWLDLRNRAAHGDYDTYDLQQVSLMLQGVRAFILRYPAA